MLSLALTPSVCTKPTLGVKVSKDARKALSSCLLAGSASTSPLRLKRPHSPLPLCGCGQVCLGLLRLAGFTQEGSRRTAPAYVKVAEWQFVKQDTHL